jgi:ParB family chromosome partitioning protein
MHKNIMGIIKEMTGHAAVPKLVVRHVPVDRISQNPYQPRRIFDQESHALLTRSVKECGVIVPVVVRRTPHGYELICGERRLRACREAGLKTIPAVIRDLTTPQMLELAFIENFQRVNLTPVEEIEIYDRLRKEFAYVPESEFAKRLGHSGERFEKQRWILGLPATMKKALLSRLITLEHADAIRKLSSEELMLATVRVVCDKKLTPKQTEALVARIGRKLRGD